MNSALVGAFTKNTLVKSIAAMGATVARHFFQTVGPQTIEGKRLGAKGRRLHDACEKVVVKKQILEIGG